MTETAPASLEPRPSRSHRWWLVGLGVAVVAFAGFVLLAPNYDVLHGSIDLDSILVIASTKNPASKDVFLSRDKAEQFKTLVHQCRVTWLYRENNLVDRVKGRFHPVKFPPSNMTAGSFRVRTSDDEEIQVIVSKESDDILGFRMRIPPPDQPILKPRDSVRELFECDCGETAEEIRRLIEEVEPADSSPAPEIEQPAAE